jgi:hypothetical protein
MAQIRVTKFQREHIRAAVVMKLTWRKMEIWKEETYRYSSSISIYSSRISILRGRPCGYGMWTFRRFASENKGADCTLLSPPAVVQYEQRRTLLQPSWVPAALLQGKSTNAYFLIDVYCPFLHAQPFDTYRWISLEKISLNPASYRDSKPLKVSDLWPFPP